MESWTKKRHQQVLLQKTSAERVLQRFAHKTIQHFNVLLLLFLNLLYQICWLSMLLLLSIVDRAFLCVSSRCMWEQWVSLALPSLLLLHSCFLLRWKKVEGFVLSGARYWVFYIQSFIFRLLVPRMVLGLHILNQFSTSAHPFALWFVGSLVLLNCFPNLGSRKGIEDFQKC